MAVHLLRLTHWMQDVEGIPAELRYFRDVVGHETDFIILRKSRPWIAVEVKMEEQNLDRGLRYLLERVQIPHAFQTSLKGTRDYVFSEIKGCRVRIVPATRFLASLP